MGTETAIQWADHTFNPWIGCAKVSPGCANCYAAVDTPARVARGKGRELWGKDADRQVTSDANWAKPRKWDREAERLGVRRRVFCASQGDVFEDREDLVDPRIRLFDLINETPHLDWLLLTKRPETWRKVMRDTIDAIRRRGSKSGLRWCLLDWLQEGQPSGSPYWPNIWFGVSVEDQKRADERIPALLEIPARVRFLSMEPLLDAVSLRAAVPWQFGPDRSRYFDSVQSLQVDGKTYPAKRIDWVIIGGESGPDARPCDLAWIRSVRDQCKAAGVPVFVKQLGSRPFDSNGADGFPAAHEIVTSENMHSPATLASLAITLELMSVPLGDKKGGNPNEWPEDLRIREFPIPKGGVA